MVTGYKPIILLDVIKLNNVCVQEWCCFYAPNKKLKLNMYAKVVNNIR